MNLDCDSNVIADQPVNCNLTFFTQDPTLIVNVESIWYSFLSGKYERTFKILNRK